jgi:hypothetical protein
VFRSRPEPFFSFNEAFAGLFRHKNICNHHMRKLAV